MVSVPFGVGPDTPAGTTAVHVNVAPAVALVSETAVVAFPEHTVCDGCENVTTGDGLTVMVKDCGAPTQPLDVGVTVIVAVFIVFEVFVAVNEAMLPVPDAARPMEGSELVHE